MIDDVLCTAPLTSILIDTNKGVRPCCYYEGHFLGNIKEQTISEIMSNERWKKLKEQMYAKEWPKECLGCKKIEDDSGTSLRHSYVGGGGIDIEGWENGKITLLEFNGSNICNLACLHCHGGFSSKWVIEAKKIREFTISKQFDPETENRLLTQYRSFTELTDTTRYQPTSNMHVPDVDLVVDNLKQLDLSNLKMAIFKGGEPLLNAETVAVLEYLDELDLLSGIKVSISTNGTYINKTIVNLLRKCKHVQFLISVDGVGELFNYIRYGDAKFDDIEKVLAVVNQLRNTDILFNNTAMNYNAFNLLEIRDWAIEMSNKYDRVSPNVGFNNFVQSPNYLSMSTLDDDTRAYLIKYYTENSISEEFKYVINVLKNDRLGDDIHFKWVEYTEIMEKLRGNSITSIVPELKKELRRN
jgi:radical SAM protein with 4Fe4S-binding SPASM domain